MPTERREGAIRVGATGQRATGGARRFQRKAAVFGGWHEPDESRGSCPDLGAARGETPRADSANPHVAFDVAGAGDVAWSRGISAKAGAPVLDPTDVLGDSHFSLQHRPGLTELATAMDCVELFHATSHGDGTRGFIAGESHFEFA